MSKVLIVVATPGFLRFIPNRIALQFPQWCAVCAQLSVVQVGRVKIQVYRGPSKGDYDFAPWGYYNTQPADLGVPTYH